MEHLNRLVKTAMEGLGANKANINAMTRIGKAVGLLSHIIQSFDEETNVSWPSGKHTKKNWDGDPLKIIDELSGAADIFKKRTSTVHTSFKLASTVF